MSKHTSEPWILSEGDMYIYVSGGPNNDDIAEFNFADEHTVKITREEAVANARLFWAAPKMLKALNAAAGYLLNARIDLETGAPKRTAIQTIEGGLKLVRAALAEAENQS